MPFLTVAVPVCGQSEYLQRCLDSIFFQTDTDYELIVVDDSLCNDKRARKIFDSYMKTRTHKEKKHTQYITHNANKGSLQARITAAENAHGKYLVCIDSDDEFADNTVFSRLHYFADTDKTDFIQFGASLCGDASHINKELQNAWSVSLPLSLYKGKKEADLLDHLFIECDLNTFIWSKMIRTELFLQACNALPLMYVFNRDDLLLCFFIASLKPSFSVHQECLYHYYTGGETGVAITADEIHWRRTLSVSSVFSAIFFYIDEHPELEEYRSIMTKKYFSAVRETIYLFDRTVTDTFHAQAESMLYNAWGKNIVERVRKAMNETN